MGVAESIQDIDSEHAKINSAQPLFYHTKSIVKIKIGINIGINLVINIGANMGPILGSISGSKL